MKTMHDAITLGNIPVKNRFVRSATFEYGGDDTGRFRQNMYDTVKGLAKGDVGLMITGMVAVDENAGIVPNMIKTYDESFVPGMRCLTDLAHQHDSTVVAQIAHCGIKVKETDSGLPPMAISQRQDMECREMTKEDFAVLAHLRRQLFTAKKQEPMVFKSMLLTAICSVKPSVRFSIDRCVWRNN